MSDPNPEIQVQLIVFSSDFGLHVIPMALVYMLPGAPLLFDFFCCYFTRMPSVFFFKWIEMPPPLKKKKMVPQVNISF